MNNPTKFPRAIARQAVTAALVVSFAISNALAVAASTNNDDLKITLSQATVKYTTDLTQLGRQGRLQENPNLSRETSHLIRTLAEGGIRQPVIVGEDKAFQNAVVEQVALRITAGRMPAQFKGSTILRMESEALFSNVQGRDEAAKMIDAIVADAVASNGHVVLYVDSLADLLGPRAV